MADDTNTAERETLMDLIDAYAEARHLGGCHTYNANTAEARAKVVASLAASAGIACQCCGGSGEVFEHSEDCDDDLCALNGDEHSCTGVVRHCSCKASPIAVGATQTHIAAMERAWLWMENQADAQSKGGHATFDLLMLREERDALRAAIDAAASAGSEPVALTVYSLQWPEDVESGRINLSTMFDTEAEAKNYAERCRDPETIRVVTLYAHHSPPEGMAGWKLVPVEPTEEMKTAAVKYANGTAVYKNVKAEVLRIEEGIYGEVYEAMIAAAPPLPASEAKEL